MTDETKILIVDDDADIRQIVRTILEDEGYAVLEAENGLTGVEMASSDDPALILMDIGMPDIDGYEATRRIKKQRDLSSIPVIFLTGRSEEEDQGASFAAGAISYVRKPFTAQQLKDIIMIVILSLGVRNSAAKG